MNNQENNVDTTQHTDERKVAADTSDTTTPINAEAKIPSGMVNEDTGEDYDAATKKQQVEELKQTIEDRKSFATWVRWLNGIYLVIILIIVILVGCGCLSINDSVLIMLLGTTTANVLGLTAIILKGLFPVKENTKNEAEKDKKGIPPCCRCTRRNLEQNNTININK